MAKKPPTQKQLREWARRIDEARAVLDSTTPAMTDPQLAQQKSSISALLAAVAGEIQTASK